MSPEGPRDPDLQPQLEGRNVDEISFLLSSRRTRLSFQRTRMSSDRTLMSVVRTALSLIGFGFTIFQFFNTLRKSDAGQTMLRPEAPRNFGMALIILGVLLLTLGIIGHLRFMTEFRREHDTMVQERLIPHDHLPYSVTLLIAILLWFVGLVAIANGLMRAGPLG